MMELVYDILTFIAGILFGLAGAGYYLKMKIDKMKEGGFEQAFDEAMEITDKMMTESDEPIGEPIQAEDGEDE